MRFGLMVKWRRRRRGRKVSEWPVQMRNTPEDVTEDREDRLFCYVPFLVCVSLLGLGHRYTPVKVL